MEFFCTKESPMPLWLGPKAEKLGMLWHHNDAEETEESIAMDGNVLQLHCPNCEYTYFARLPD
jgi:hypothetical protein